MDFRCQICGDVFPAIPDMMLEVETGKIAIRDKTLPFDIQLLAEDSDPDLPDKFGICMCLDCQQELLDANILPER